MAISAQPQRSIVVKTLFISIASFDCFSLLIVRGGRWPAAHSRCHLCWQAARSFTESSNQILVLRMQKAIAERRKARKLPPPLFFYKPIMPPSVCIRCFFFPLFFLSLHPSAGASPRRRAPAFTVFLYTSGRRISPSVMQHPILFIIYTVVISRVQPLGCSNATSGINYEPCSTLTSQPEEMCLSLQCFSASLRRQHSAAYRQPRAHCVSSQTMAARRRVPSGRLQPAGCLDFQERSCRKCSGVFFLSALSAVCFFKQRFAAAC